MTALAPPQSRSRRLVPAVVATSVAAVLCALALRWYGRSDALRLLAGASPRSGREIEARVSGGFPWAPYQPAKVTRQEKRTFHSAIRSVLGRAEADSSTLHAAAIARICGGDPRGALRTLESLGGSPNAQARSDLAAAEYQFAVSEEEPERLARALVAVDDALRVDPALPEAHFNRALILERLGMRDLARLQWEAYLGLDSASGWAEEARAHVRALAPQESFDDALKRQYALLASNPDAAHTFALQYRQRSRTAGETEILGDWGRSILRGDEGDASKHLAVARGLAGGLARDGGNQSFIHAVSAIQSATPSRRQMLAHGHVQLQLGRRHSAERRYEAARQLYASAAAQLGAGGSPAAVFRAETYAANMLHEQGRHDEARQAETRLLEQIPDAYSAYRAETLWMLAAIAHTQGQLGVCLDSFERSLELFQQLGETQYAAMVRGQIVYALDRVADPRAWKNRVLMLRELGLQLSTQQAEALGSVTHAALLEQDWPMALSFLRLEIDVARRVHPAVLIQSLLYRAETYGRMDRLGEAMRDVVEARQLLARTESDAVRDRLGAIADAVEGSLSRDPARALPLLTRAVEYQSTRGRRSELPESLRKRARAWLAAGDTDRAMSDLEAAIAEVERHRGFLPEGEGRWGAFHSADELFRDAMDLALSRNDPSAALRYAERARARTLLETIGVPWNELKLDVLPRDTVLVEYAAYHDGLRIFVADRDGVRAHRHSAGRRALVGGAAALREAAARGDEARMRQAGRALAQHLIDPIERELGTATSLIVVADSTLSMTPFAALTDAEGRFLAERFAISVAPSAAFALHDRPEPGDPDDKVLLVSVGGATAQLPAVAAEMRALRRLYPDATVLSGPDVTADAFERAFMDARKLHFAGHAVSDDGTYLLLGGKDGRATRLDQARISEMRMPRVDVVVLAACATARGQSRATEGTISVARAFLAAGARSVVATLWPISDADAASFFPLLHRHLASGATPPRALQAAQREWSMSKRSPAMWAAVQVIGR
jgi:CHAT domain-containing protein